MTPERWKQVSALYDTALARPPGARAAFLAEACGSDEGLRREVQALLDQPTSPTGLDGLTPSAVGQAMGFVAGADMTGRQFGAYRLRERIGAGGMGEVYRARDTRLGRDVAVKVLPPAFADDPDRIARFEREARVLASLDHPHIGTIHGIEESQGVRALVLALVEGDTLADRITRGPLPISEALEYAKQIADALEAAHEKGIVHRDLKPANIKITPAGIIKVLDFGLAKLWTGDTGSAGGDNLTHSPVLSAGTRMGTILGTAAYMSPEQARGKPVDRRTDIWAFGCVLFEMLTGTRAFAGQDVADVLARVIEREPDFESLPATTPPAIRRLLRRSLEKDHRRRLSDIADARLEIDEAIAEPAAPAATRAGARWRVGAAASLLTAVMLSGLAALYSGRGVPEAAINRFEIVTSSPTFDSVSFALSPDGRQLVFLANVNGQQQLWIRPLDQTQAQPLAGTEGASYPFWAPDSRSIGFFAHGKLKRLDLGGGQPIELADAPLALGGSWGSDGTILFAPYERRSFTKLMRVPASGGGVATPVPGAEFGSPRLPEFLPDGRHFLFDMRWTRGDRNGPYLGALDSREVRRLPGIDEAVSYAPPGYLLFVHQGALMAVSFDASTGTVGGEAVTIASAVNAIRRGAFSVSANGLLAHRGGSASGRQLTWFDRGGKVVGTMGPVDTGPFASPELAPDGRRVAIGRGVAGNIDVWLMEAAADAWSRFTFTTSPSAGNYPVWAPDGSRLVFASNRKHPDRFTQIFEKPSDGSGDERLLFASNSNPIWPVDWSRDGRTLLYSNQDPKTDGDLWALPLTGDGRPFPVAQTSFLEDEGQFSPDGRWVAFRSNRSGREEIYVQAFPDPAGSQLVSAHGGSQPRWRPDGTELFYVAPDNMLMVAAIGQATGQRLETSKPAPLFRTRLEAGVLQKQQYAVAPDGQRFLMNVLAEETNVPPITIVQNWTLALER
jgi:serine/threonine protein kinase/Tol biopolymer transport system component